MAKTTKIVMTKSLSNPKSKPTTPVKQITKPKLIAPKVSPLSRSVRSVRTIRKPFGNLSADIQSMIGWKLLGSFDLNQQIKFRLISSTWDYNVRLACRQIRSLVLTFKCPNIYRDRDRDCADSFNANVAKNLSQLKSCTKLKLTMREKHLKTPTFEQMGKLFTNVEHLTLCEPEPSISVLDKLVQQFPKTTSFSLIISEYIKTKDFLNQLFETINDHLAPLTTLNLHFTYDSLSTNVFPKLKLENCHKTLSYLQNFSFYGSIENQQEIIEMVGQSLSSRFPIQSLSMRVERLEVSQIGQMFEHNPRLSQMKQLQLMKIKSEDIIYSLLDHFTKLESLKLWAKRIFQSLNAKMIESLRKLNHLSELELYQFNPCIFDLGFIVPLPNIVRLKIARIYLYAHLLLEYYQSDRAVDRNEDGNTDKVFRTFIVNLSTLFPNLEELTIECRHEFNNFTEDMRDFCRVQFVKLTKVNLSDR